MRRLRRIQKSNSTAVILRHFFGCAFAPRALLISIFFLNFGGLLLIGQEPNYVHNAAESKDLDRFSVTATDALNPQAKINRMVIAVDIGPDGQQYVLTFGNGIKKVGANGGLVDFIPNTSDRLSNAMDFAINSDGKFFVATNESNRRFVRVYSSNGTYLENETLGDGTYGTGANKFKGPVGLTFDKDDNLYVADHYLGDANPPPSRPSSIKIYRKDATGTYKNNLITEFDNVNGSLLNFPYRIAVNSHNQIYMSELGADNTAKVKIIQLDGSFNPTGVSNGPSANLGAPGSIIIDKFDNVFVADFGNDINLPRLLAATGDIEEFYAVFEIIKQGIRNDVFNINVYNPDNSFRSKISTGLDFIIDLAISKCGTLYANNAIFDGQIKKIFGILVPDITMDFDLEVFDRSSGYDTEPPQIMACPGDQEAELNNGSYQLKDYRNLASFKDNCDDDLTIVQNPASGTSITKTTVVTLTAVDDSGNESEKCSFQVIIKDTPDTTDPIFTYCQHQIFPASTGQCGAVVNYSVPTATDDSGSVDVIRTDGPAPGEFFSIGATSVIYTATDAAGNIATCTFIVTVEDKEPPVFTTCIGNEVQQISEENGNYIVPDYRPKVEATDNCSTKAKITYTQSIAPGTAITAGTTMQIFAFDEFNNKSVACSFQVELVAAQDVILEDCPGDFIVNSDPGTCGAVVTFTTPKAMEGDKEVEVLQVAGPPSGSLFAVGFTTVVFEAKNSSNEVFRCSFQVTVNDLELPTLTCPDDISVTVAPGETKKVVHFSNLPATDNCSASVVQTEGPPSGSEFPIGEHTIEFTVTDPSGNRDSCSFKIFVAGPQEPDPLSITCPGDQSLDLEEQCDVPLPSYTYLASASDGAVVSQSPPAGTPVSEDTRVTLMASLNGENKSCFFEVQIKNEPEIILYCLEDHSVDPDDNGNYTLPDYTILANVFGACGAYTVSQNPPKGSVITKDTEISLAVVDENGKEDACSFIVKLGLTQPPVVTCKSTDLFLTASGDNTLVPKELYYGDVNDPSIEKFTVDRDYFTCEDLGPQPVILTVHFKDGTTQNCSTEILVRDSIQPNVYCVAPGKTFSLTNGSVTINVDDLLEGLDDNCGEPGYRLSQDIFTSVGTKTLSIIAEDASGNIEECTTTIEIVEETTTPGTCKPAIVYLNASGNATLEPKEVFDGNPDDPSIVSMEVDRKSFTCADLEAPVQVNLTVKYANGSSTSCSASVTVKDDIAPVVSCVPEFTLFLNEEGYGILSPEILDRGSSDNCGVGRMSLSKSRFETSDVGEQPVILTVTDASGNAATCETIVTVIPFEDGGGVTCPQDITISLKDNGEFELKLTYSGNDENIELHVSQSQFTCDDLGTTVVTASYLGEHTGSCDINVTVIDDLPPVANCIQEIDLRLNASGTASLAAEDLDLDSSDNCGISGLSLSKYNFTRADVGMQQVTFTATDGSGNRSTCTVMVNVISNDETNPVECVDRFLLEIGANGRAVLNPRDLFTGGSGTAQFTVSKDTFTCNDLGENSMTLNYSTPTEEGSCEVTVIVEDTENRCEEPTESPGDYIILYPNPSGGLVRFQTSPGLVIERMEVFDMRGRYLFTKTFESISIFDTKLDLREYQAGVYTILIYTNGKEFLKRAIIRNE